MSQLKKKLSLVLSILLVIVSLSGLTAYAGENDLTVYGVNGNATHIEKGTSMTMAVSGVSAGKAVTWSVTDLDGSATNLAAITPTGSLTAILTASSENYGTFKVVAAQNDGSGKTGEQIIQITDENLITVDDTDSSIIYESAGSGEGWETNNIEYCYQGAGKSVITPEDGSYSSSAPAYAEFTFTGTGIQWIGETNYTCGVAEVYLDDAKVSTVDPFIAPDLKYQFINFSKEGMPYGQHTIKVVATGQKNPASTVYPGTRVLIDAFRYIPGTPVQEVDKTELQNKIAEAQALHEVSYTHESWSALQSVLSTAITVNSNPDATQDDVNTAASDLVNAMTGLVPLGPAALLSGADRVLPGETFTLGIGLYNIREDVYAEDIDLSYDTTVFEFVSIEGENDDIQIAGKDVSVPGSVWVAAGNFVGVTGDSTPVLKITFKVKSGVENTSGSIAVTKALLGTMPGGGQITAAVGSKTIIIGSTETVDKSELSKAINSAEALFSGAVVGNQPGQCPKAAKDALRAAIDQAGLVLNDGDADQGVVNDAVTALNGAVDIFKAAVLTEETSPDINTDNNIDVLDLAIVAYYYGKDSNSEDWARAKAADVTLDGKVDVSDLAYVASRITD
jgi:Cohesin domain./Uncharacterised Sugar-binding Domain.